MLPCLACGTCSLSSVEDKSRRTDGPCSPTVPVTEGLPRSRPSASGSVATAPTHLSACADSVFRPCKGVQPREIVTPHPTPLAMGEGADQVRGRSTDPHAAHAKQPKAPP